MFPFLRMIGEFWVHRKSPPLPWNGTHVSTHRCQPWDLDMFMELNNGRTLTLYDLGRIPLAGRVGLTKALAKNRWGLTMAGVSVRYRKRITLWQKFEMRSRCVGWDDRFMYLDQTIWLGETCAGQALYRSAVTDKNGIVNPDRVLAAMGADIATPVMPDWVQAWIDADAQRPWPPERA